MADDVIYKTLSGDCNHTVFYKVHVMSIYFILVLQLYMGVCISMGVHAHTGIHVYVCQYCMYIQYIGYCVYVYIYTQDKQHMYIDVQ